MRLFALRLPVGRARRPSPARSRARARRAVLLIAPAFVLVLAVAWTAAEGVAPEITDTDYHARLRIARAAAEHPDRPLGVVLGSSRAVWAFRPEQLPESGVCWVNAAHTGGGPTLSRLILHRLLRDGVRPAAVALEVMPTFFVKENNRFVSGHFAGSELPLMRAYADKPLDYDYHFLRHRLTRLGDLGRVADPFAGRTPPHPRGGFPAHEEEVSPAERARRTALAHAANAPHLQKLAARPAADRAFRDTLREATDHGIAVVVLRMPEGPTFRSWYDPAALARFDAYVAAVAAEHGAAVVDARLWLEEDDFYDSHHALRRGADKFTARFARELPAALAARPPR
jgi:hypothetical protein